MKKYIITEELLQDILSDGAVNFINDQAVFTYRKGDAIKTARLLSDGQPSKKSLLERQTEAAEQLVKSLDKIERRLKILNK